MRRVLIMIAVFGLVALIAAYVATTPHASSVAPAPVHDVLARLDAAAARLVAIRGREVAMAALLAAGAMLAGLAGLAAGRGRKAGLAPAAGAPGPVWRPEPVQPEPVQPDRIANLRRRAMAEAETDDPPPAETTSPFPRPVVLVRKPRDRDRDWFGDRCWLGGLPRLGGTEWPRDAAGTPLPFVAQLDLAEIAAACPESPLPATGSLAFFLGAGAVVAVPEGGHDFSDPPPDLPPAFEEGGAPFPAVATRLSRHFFPFWPVEPIAIDLPDPLRDHRDPGLYDAIERATAGALSHHVLLRTGAFGAGGDALWWHGVSHLADRLHVALESGTLADQREDLAQMVAAMDGFASGRDPWQQLTPDECDVVEDILAELHASYGETVRRHIPLTSGELATISLRAMIAGGPETLAAMPEEHLTRINREYRLTTLHQHQVFGLGGNPKSSVDADMLLLQLGCDDMMEWRWGETGVFQFRIAPEDAAAGNWGAARLTFEAA